MDTTMHATHATAEPGHEHVTLAFLDNDSTLNVTVPLVEAARLATTLTRAVKDTAGIPRAISTT